MPRPPRELTQEIDRIIVYLFALFVVWPLWLVEQYLYSPPEIIEEVVKTGLVYWLVRSGNRRWWEIGIVGLCFALSETMFYLLVANNFMNLEPIYARVLFTWPLHIVTVLVVWKIGTSKYRTGWLLGFSAAVVIHVLFNRLIGLTSISF